ncbi:hypothetical protein M433DRAFT_73311 [Acidomyces richmondensis BFW]|nr:MAG: hypothetical protein FE78DRAFT_148968 [Acidomyces sp. 'richmondensis']KYG42655.1 hypothetical protein M433DRAFT_73311 [Acidomyces richmondensis BFW]
MFSSKKPYTAVTVQIDRLTSEQYEEEDVGGIIDLIEVIRIQASGPTEAARAIRKKLKYGNPHRQIRALVILDGLIQNAGPRFQRAFADEPLLERLRLMAREETVDPQVREKCKVLFVQWANAYRSTPGLEGIANLYKDLPKSQRPAAARQKVLRESENIFESDSERDPPPATSSSSKHHRAGSRDDYAAGRASPSGSSGKPFNLAREKENMTNAIAQSSIASTNLLNGLQLINRETERISENAEIVRRFEKCKALRRQILMYIQHVESDDWIGSLVNANDELVKALTAYEIMDRSIEDDSDSDEFEQHPQSSSPVTHKSSQPVSADTATQLAGLQLAEHPAPAKPPRPTPGHVAMPPPRPAPPPEEGEDEGEDDDDADNPFGDANAAPTPAVERPGMTWKDI